MFNKVTIVFCLVLGLATTPAYSTTDASYRSAVELLRGDTAKLMVETARYQDGDDAEKTKKQNEPNFLEKYIFSGSVDSVVSVLQGAHVLAWFDEFMPKAIQAWKKGASPAKRVGLTLLKPSAVLVGVATSYYFAGAAGEAFGLWDTFPIGIENGSAETALYAVMAVVNFRMGSLMARGAPFIAEPASRSSAGLSAIGPFLAGGLLTLQSSFRFENGNPDRVKVAQLDPGAFEDFEEKARKANLQRTAKALNIEDDSIRTNFLKERDKEWRTSGQQTSFVAELEEIEMPNGDAFLDDRTLKAFEKLAIQSAEAFSGIVELAGQLKEETFTPKAIAEAQIEAHGFKVEELKEILAAKETSEEDRGRLRRMISNSEVVATQAKILAGKI